MKKVLAGIGVALAMFAYTNTNAQLALGGVKAGVNYTNINGIHDDSESEINPTGGLFVQFGQRAHLKYGIEFLYSPKSTSYSINTTDTTSKVTKNLDYKVKFNYIDIPILVSYNFFNDSAKFRPRVYAGPCFGVRVGASSDLKYSYKNDKDSTLAEGEIKNENIVYNYSPVDVGVAVGVGVNYMITEKMYAVVDVRYVRSLSDLNENPTAAIAVRNMNIAVHAGIAFRFGGKAAAAPAPAPATGTN